MASNAPTIDTVHPSIKASSLHDLEQMALTTLQTIDMFLPEIRMIAGFTPFGGAIIQGVTMINPLIERALIFAMAETGKSFNQVLADFVAHVTPGMESHSVFGPNGTDDGDDPSRLGSA